MTEQRNFIGNWIKINPDLQPHKVGYEDVLQSRNARQSGAFKLAPVLPPLQANSATELRKRVLGSQRIENAVELLTASLGKPVAEIAAIAASEYDAMAANLEPLAVRSLFYLITPVINKLFSHIFVNVKSLEKIREAMLRHPVVLLPSHKSYLDFILLDVALYICDMPLPTIAAATDFSNMKIVGEWLRRCGAFFVQRGTGSAANLVTTTMPGDDETKLVTRPLLVVSDHVKAEDWKFIAADYLHRAILAEYIHQLVVYGHHRFLEFFIEGKRSRTGKACPPKRGLLNSIAEAYLHGDVDDIYICPVSICYDRFLEEGLYARELLGTPKPKESTWGLLQSVRSILENNYGSVVFTFGEPISLRSASTGRIDRQLHALHPAWIGSQTVGEREFLTELSLHIIDMHHQLTSLPIFSLVAACFTATAFGKDEEPKLPLGTLIEKVGWLIGLLTASHRSSASLSLSHSLDATVLDVLRLHSNILTVNREDGNVVLKNDGSADAGIVGMVQLGIYRNQGMFALFPIAAICLAMTSLKETQEKEISHDALFKRYAFLSKVLRLEFVSSENLGNESGHSMRQVFDRTISFMLETHLIFKSLGNMFYDVSRSASNPDALFLGAFLQPFVFGYSLCSAFLLLQSSSPAIFKQNVEHNTFLNSLLQNPAKVILSTTLKLSRDGAMPQCSAWALSSDLIANALVLFSELGAVAKPVKSKQPMSVHVNKMTDLQNRMASYLPPYCPSTAAALAPIIFMSSGLTSKKSSHPQQQSKL